MPKKTLIFATTFERRENTRPLCERIAALGIDADVLLLDDGSRDGTGEELDRLASEFPRLRIQHEPERRGTGVNHLDAIERAYREGYDRLVTLDGEYAESPRLIPTFLARGEHADVVVGSRHLESGSLPDWSLLRRSLSGAGHLLTKHLLGLSQDATTGFRCYDLNAIPRELFGLIEARGYDFLFESLLVLQRNGHAIAEVPIKLPKSTYETTKMSLADVPESVRTLFSLFYQDQTNPARFRLTKEPVELDPALIDPQNWNEYWEKKSQKSTAVYDAIATVYRNAIIKRRLEQTLRREFAPGARLLHAGCGSGHVDAGLHGRAKITAVDISPSALAIYRRHNPDAEEVRHASIFDLPFASGSFDGAYNLGVVEHFEHDELVRAFTEVGRVLRPRGKLVVFWPHARATSVAVIKSAHFILNDVLHKDVRFHPPEVSLVHSRQEARELLAEGGFELESYEFGAKDFFVQSVVVGTRR
ncbi:MAG TPA: methyltransferase domain-containing protein [Polyangiaceae bacterium]|nr:methyltransferase domain-containing protein [Polyangiaceae bacterium]